MLHAATYNYVSNDIKLLLFIFFLFLTCFLLCLYPIFFQKSCDLYLCPYPSSCPYPCCIGLGGNQAFFHSSSAISCRFNRLNEENFKIFRLFCYRLLSVILTKSILYIIHAKPQISYPKDPNLFSCLICNPQSNFLFDQLFVITLVLIHFFLVLCHFLLKTLWCGVGELFLKNWKTRLIFGLQ